MPDSPPPLPPKSPSIRTTATHSSTNLSESDTHTVSTHHHHSPARPTHAQKGVRHQASFHTINQFMPPQSTPALASTTTTAMVTGSSQTQTQRQTSNMLDTAAIISMAGEGGSSGSLIRTPSFSFLTSDPNRAPTPSTSSHGTFSTLSRQSSSASIGIHVHTQAQAQALPPLSCPVPVTPEQHPHRLSALRTRSGRSGRSGMADIDPTSPPPASSPASNVTYPSAMAVHSHPSSPTHTPVSGRGSSSFRRARSTKSTKSVKSITPTSSGSISSKTKKRASNSTIHRRSFQRKYGKWEVGVDEMNRPLIPGEDRQGEEELELAALLGRATVLERMLRAGKRVSGTSLPTLRLASRPSTKTTTASQTSHARPSLSISIRSVRRHLSRRLKHRHEDQDQFTDLDSQSGFGSIPPVEVLLTERERGWVVLLPERDQRDEREGKEAPTWTGPTSNPPALPGKDQDQCFGSPMCLSFGSPSRTIPDEEKDVDVDVGPFRQSPHLGHRDRDYHKRQSVLSYISVGRWSASTQGILRRRRWIVGISIASIVGVIVLTGVLAGLLSKRKEDEV